eukprot:jgi/Ulvmu1/10700/UM067_0026.1
MHACAWQEDAWHAWPMPRDVLSLPQAEDMLIDEATKESAAAQLAVLLQQPRGGALTFVAGQVRLLGVVHRDCTDVFTLGQQQHSVSCTEQQSCVSSVCCSLRV